MPHLELDTPTRELINELAGPGKRPPFSNAMHHEHRQWVYSAYSRVEDLTPSRPDEASRAERIVAFFQRLLEVKADQGFFSDQMGFPREELTRIALQHQEMDAHGVSLGGRVYLARPYLERVNQRVEKYLRERDRLAPTGITLWAEIRKNQRNVRKTLRMQEEEWNSFTGQMNNAVDSLLTLSQIVKIPEEALTDLMRITQRFKIRMTPYWASLIVGDVPNDPILLQSLPTAEMLENQGELLPPICAAHSPAALVDQLYPQTAALKACNACAVSCAHCLRMDDVQGAKRDKGSGDAAVLFAEVLTETPAGPEGCLKPSFRAEAYYDALNYLRRTQTIRDVLVTGGDPLLLPDYFLLGLLKEIASMDHVKVLRIGTRVPVAAPHRITDNLLSILSRINKDKPLRIMTHINSAREITPVSREALKRLSSAVSAVLNQTVLLRGVNDTRFAMWRLCETLQEAYVKPHYLLNCSHRDPRFAHLRVPVIVGQDLVESMYGVLSGDAIPRYMGLAQGKVPLEKGNVTRVSGKRLLLTKPWTGVEEPYPDANINGYRNPKFGFLRYER